MNLLASSAEVSDFGLDFQQIVALGCPQVRNLQFSHHVLLLKLAGDAWWRLLRCYHGDLRWLSCHRRWRSVDTVRNGLRVAVQEQAVVDQALGDYAALVAEGRGDEDTSALIRLKRRAP